MSGHLERAIAALGQLPAALSDEIIRPLAIGVGDDLRDRLVGAGMDAAEAENVSYRVLREYTRRDAYRMDLCEHAAWRVDLDGNRVEPVEKEHALAASNNVLANALRAHAKAMKGASNGGRLGPAPQPKPQQTKPVGIHAGKPVLGLKRA